LWIRSIKLYADGALGSRGAALLDPYADDPKNMGLLKTTPEHLRDVSTRALQHGFQVGTHAIGDRGNRVALDAYEAALKAVTTGVILPNGSGFPVGRVNPLFSFHAAVSRQDDNSWPPGGWFPEQRMTREEALKSMTIWPAFAGFQEQLTGSLTPGKYADFVIL